MCQIYTKCERLGQCVSNAFISQLNVLNNASSDDENDFLLVSNDDVLPNMIVLSLFWTSLFLTMSSIVYNDKTNNNEPTQIIHVPLVNS